MKLSLPTGQVLCIVYSSGGTADVARHAVQAALDRFEGPIRVLTSDPHTTLFGEGANWNCACPGGHTISANDDTTRLDVRTVNVAHDDLKPHLENVGAVICGLGNRQPWHGDNIATTGTTNLIQAMMHHHIQRLILITSAGCNEDYPPVEFHWVGTILKGMFFLLARKEYKDLCGAENVVRNNEKALDYLIIRPVGLGEDRPPVDEWCIQKEKYQDKVGFDMSKLDCARFCLQEAIDPTYHRHAVVIGSDFDKCEAFPSKKKSQEEEVGAVSSTATK